MRVGEWFFPRAILAEHRKAPFDGIHCHSIELPTRYGVIVRHLAGVPVIATTCGHDALLRPELGWDLRTRPFYDNMVRNNVRRVDVVGSVSHAITMELRAMGATARIAEIPNGVDWPSFQSRSEGWLRSRLGLRATDLLILSLGRYHPIKDYVTGLRAVKLLLESPGVPQGVHYAIIGTGVEGLAPVVAEMGLQGRVHLVPNLPMADVPKALWDADVFLSTSRVEGFAQVVAQAMACARPVVLTDCPGNEDLAGCPGVLLGRVGDPGSLASAMARLAHDPAGRAAMGRAAHEESRRFAWGRIAEHYLALFEGLARPAGSLLLDRP